MVSLLIYIPYGKTATGVLHPFYDPEVSGSLYENQLSYVFSRPLKPRLVECTKKEWHKPAQMLLPKGFIAHGSFYGMEIISCRAYQLIRVNYKLLKFLRMKIEIKS